jgi:organic hydroperoxide reductase OsmC/OhrA
MLQTYEGSSPTVRPCVAAIFVTLLDSRLEVNPRLTSIPQLLVDGEKGFIESGSPDRALVRDCEIVGGNHANRNITLSLRNQRGVDRRAQGELASPGLEALQVASPPEFQGHEGMWTPEHYFVASVNSCFMTTFLAIAQMSKLEVVNFDSKAVGKLDKVEGAGYQMTEIVITPRLVIRYTKDLERARRILEKAEKNCLISNSIRSIVKLEPQEVRAEDEK